ncbi:hypothetical protein SLEP1_g46445 [Rubroshorea leprosula]|uniref:Uncharacterized protein n=1 Tax=Rubroshorea leprosula TaxID=152421 RepID=A0AAV5LPN3_9ROSI|nr:hypothetical protein SLEP1_g46445 [Rubroshorea leprosula]
MASSDAELAEQLKEAGNMLMSPPPSVHELLPLLDVSPNLDSRLLRFVILLVLLLFLMLNPGLGF